jgi:FkbM family methyltransferase
MNMRTAVIVGQNYPDALSDRLIEIHDFVVIFEPLPAAAAACRRRYVDNGKVLVVEAACGDSDGMQPMTVYNVNGLSSSLGKMTEQAQKAFYMHDLSEKEIVNVRVVNLCSFLAGMGVWKLTTLIIDAQGLDLAILKTVKPFVGSGIDYLQIEADGDGFSHYSGLPANSESAAIEWMGQFPQYEFLKLPGRMAIQPDLVWMLKGGEIELDKNA